MATQGVVVSVQAKIEGWQEQIKAIQSAMNGIKVDSSLGKAIGKDLETVVPMVNRLGQTINKRLTSDMDIAKFTDSLKEVDTIFGKIGQTMSNTSFSDLDLDYVKKNFGELVKQVEEAEVALNTGLQESFQEAIKSSDQLQKSFKALKLDPKDMNFEQLHQALTDEATKYEEELARIGEKAEEIKSKLAEARNSKQAIEKSQVYKVDANAEAKKIIGDSSSFGVREVVNTAKLKELASTIDNHLLTAKAAVKERTTEIDSVLKDMCDSTTVDQVRENVAKLQQIFTEVGASNTLQKDVQKINENMSSFDIDPDILGQKIAAIRGALEKDGLDPKEIQDKILPRVETLMKTGQWDKLPDTISDALKTTKARMVAELTATNSEIKQLQEEFNKNVRSPKGTAEYGLNMANAGRQELENNISKQLEDRTAALRQKYEETQALLELSTTKGFKDTGGGLISQSAAGIQATNAAINEYQASLAKVKSTESMISKAQGFVQRWFSIYTVVRMVRKAFTEVTSTIKQLDTTMTDIAIATNMSQKDLWAQIPQYTQMAQKYAASISGVYEVSKLYYQQGLQTKDVNYLTEATLKMARVSGLDYAESADYMTNAIRSFKMEMSDANHVVDVYSAVAASSASNAKELATAMSKTASSAQAVGSSFENTTAMLSVMIEATRESPENIGSAMKSIISRYGELKENKTGIDEEGEEYSLNKVDKALQTVGISIHDAKGEFRDFDDVIMELADNWDTIDKNTQRYIATVMAGNRQQSRFLALVSSSQRLREEAEKAANSEDASQIQFLKSLESVDGKVQQLKTSMQSLYVNSGLEETYKGLIDFATSVSTSLSALGVESGIGAVIAKIAATFTNVATLVTTAFNTVKMRFKVMEAEMTADARLAAAEREATLADEAQRRAQTAKEMELAVKQSEDAITAHSEAQSAIRTANAQKEMARQMKLRTTAGMIASTAGLALTTAAAGMDVNEEREKKAWYTGIGGALSGVGTGLMIGGFAGGIVGTLTALPSIIEAVGISSESASEKVARFEKNIEETNNTRIKAKSDLKSLSEYKQKYDDLSKSQYESAEKQKEFKDLQNEIANNYPELIKSMTAEGDYLVNMSSAYESLINTKRELYSDAFVANLGAELEGLQDIDYVLKSMYNIEPGKSRTWLGFDFEHYDEMSQNFLTSLKNIESFSSSIIPGTVSHPYGQLPKYEYESGFGAISDSALERMFFKGNFFDADLWTQDRSTIRALTSGIYSTYIQEAAKGTPFEQIEVNKNGILNQVKNDQYGTGSGININPDRYSKVVDEAVSNFSPDLYKQIIAVNKANTFASQLRESIISSSNADYIKTLSDSLKGTVKDESLLGNSVAQFAVKKTLDKQLDQYLQDNQYKIDDELTYLDEDTGKEKTYDSARLVKEFYSGTDTEQSKNAAWFQEQIEQNSLLNTDAVEEIYENLGKNATSGLKKAVQSALGLGNKWSKDGAEVLLVLQQAIDEQYGDVIERYTKWAEELSKGEAPQVSQETADMIKSFSELIGPEYLSGIQNQYETIFKNTNLSADEIDSQVSGLNQVMTSFLGQNTGFTENQQQAIISKISGADLTSLFGIYTLFDDLADMDIDLGEGAGAEFKNQMIAFSKLLKVNIPTEVAAYTNSLVDSFEGLDSDISSAINGMNAKQASKLATKMGKSISDFRVEGGKFYYDNIEDITKSYVKTNEEYQAALNEAMDTNGSQIRDALKYSEEKLNSKDALGELEAKAEDKSFTDDFLKKTNLNYDMFLQYYRGYADQNVYDDFIEYLKNTTTAETEQLEKLVTQSTAINKLKSQGFDAFKEAAGLTELDQFDEKEQSQLLDAAMNQDFSSLKEDNAALYEAAKPYFSTLLSTFKNTKKSVISQLLSGYNTGKSTSISITAANLPYLRELQSEYGMDWGLDKDDAELIGSSLSRIIDEAHGYKDLIIEGVLSEYKTDSEQLEAYQQYVSSQFKQTKVSNFKDLADGTISSDAFIKYLNENEDISAADMWTSDIVAERAKAYGLAQTESGEWYVENWAANVKELQSQLNKLLAPDSGATTKEINEARAALENAKRGQDQAIIAAGENVLKNYEDVSADQKSALATALGEDSKLLENLYYEESGKSKLDIGALRQALEDPTSKFTQHSREALLESFAEFADDATSLVDDVMSYTTTGTKKQSDIQKVVKQFKDKYTGDQLFKYDDMLDAYVFQSEYLAEFMDIQAEAYTAAMGGNKADNLAQIQKQTQKAAAAAVDFQSYLSAERQGAGSQAYEKLSKQLIAYEEAKQDYANESYTYYRSMGKTASAANRAVREAKQTNAQLRQEAAKAADVDLVKLTAGGAAAVELAKQIATDAGIELSSQDIQDTYAPYAKKLSDIGTQIAELSVGQFIDTTSQFGKTLLSAGVINTDGIVNNLDNVTQAYKQVYEQLGQSSTNATVAQINAAASQYLSSKTKKQTDAVEGLANGASMTIDTITDLYTSAGKIFGEETTGWRYNGSMKEEYTYYDADAALKDLVDEGILKDLKAGQYQIADAKGLADKLGWDTNTPQYQKAYSTLIDSIISTNEELNPMARATKEISALSSAAIGTEVNVVDIPDDIKKKLGIEGKETVQIVSEAQRNAMLQAIDQSIIDNAEDPALKAQLESIRNQINSSYMSAITKGTSLATSGTAALEDMTSFQSSFNDLMRTTKTVDELFDYNEITKNWTLKADYLRQMLQKQAQNLVRTGELGATEVDNWVKAQLKSSTIDTIDFKSVLSSGATEKQRTQMKQALDTYFEAQAETMSIAQGRKQGLSIDEIKSINQDIIQQAKDKSQETYNDLLSGGKKAMQALQEVKADASPEELQAAYDYTIAPIREVISTVADLKKGSVVAADKIGILRQAGFTVDNDGLITAVGDLVTAYASLYQQIKNHANANTMEINDAYAKYLTATEQGDIDAVAAMGEAMGMTYETLGQLLGKNGTDLETWMQANQNLYTSIGAGKIRISDFASFAKERGWEPGSEEYTSAFKTYNDSMIELNKNQKDAIKNELSQFSEAKAGDQLNLTDTWAQLTKRVSNAQAEYIAANGISGEYEARQYQALTNQTKAYNKELQAKQDQFISELSAAGVEFDQGIATLGDTVNWAGIAQAYKNYYNSIGQTIDAETASWLDNLTNRSKQELGSAYSDMVSNWQAITPEMIQSFVEAGGASSYDAAKQLLGLKDQGDGTYKLGVRELQAAMKSADIADVTKGAIAQQLSEIADNALQNIDTAVSLVTQGTKNEADMQKFLNNTKQLGVAAEGAFSYDNILGAWTLDPAVLRDYVQAQAQQLVSDGLMRQGEVQKYVDTNVRQALAKAVDIKSFLAAEDKQGQARDKLAQQMANFGIGGKSERWQDYIADFDDGKTTDYAIRKQAEFAAQKAVKANAEYREGIIQTIENGGLAAVSAAEWFAEQSGEELSSSDIEELYKSQVSRIEKASEQLTYGVGQLVTGDSIQMLSDAGYKLTLLGTSNTAVINSIGNIADAYVNYYNALQSSGEATLEALNNAKAKVLETKDGRYAEQKAIDALGEAGGMTYSTFAQLMTDMGIELTDGLMNSLESSGIIESLGGTKMRIKDFASFARAMKWDFNSEEYISAFSSYNDGLIEYNKKAKEAVSSELEGLKDIKPGDQLNLTKTEKAFKDFSKSREAYIKQAEQEIGMTNSMEANYIADQYALEDTFFNNLQNTLHGYGAHLQDGILSLSENANLLGVAETLKAAALESGSTMSAELADMVQSIVDSYTDAITKGIEGGMTNAEKEDLIRKGADMGITHKDSDFYQTAEGWQMSTQAGMAYYNTMTLVDIRSRKKIYNSLTKTLKETNNSYKTTSSMLARIGELTRELNKLNQNGVKTGDQRKQELQDEINLLNEMYANSLSHKDDSWDFLSQNPYPEGMENALTFWKNVADLDYSMSQWSMSGTIDDVDRFTAGLAQAQSMSESLGHAVQYAGMMIGDADIGGNFTLNDWLSGYTDYTSYDPSTGKTTSSVAVLSKLLGQYGFNLNKGGLDEASVQELAERNAAIMESFEAFGESMTSIQKTLNDYSSDDFKHSFEDFVENGAFSSKDFLKQMETNSKNYDNFMKFAEKVQINGETLKNILNSASGQIEEGTDNFKAVSGLFKAAMSEGVDLEHSYQAVSEILASNGFEGQITLYDTTYDIRGGRGLFQVGDKGEWVGPDGKTYKTAEQAWKAYNEQDAKDLAEQLNGYNKNAAKSDENTLVIDDVTYEVTFGDDGTVTLTSGGKEVTGNTINEAVENLWDESSGLTKEQWKIKTGLTILPEISSDKGTITEETRSQIKSQLDLTQDTYSQLLAEWGGESALGKENLVFEEKFGVKLVPEVDAETGEQDYSKALNQLAKQIDFDATALSVEQGVSKALATAMEKGIGTEGNEIPIKVKPEFVSENPFEGQVFKVKVEMEADSDEIKTPKNTPKPSTNGQENTGAEGGISKITPKESQPRTTTTTKDRLEALGYIASAGASSTGYSNKPSTPLTEPAGGIGNTILSATQEMTVKEHIIPDTPPEHPDTEYTVTENIEEQEMPEPEDKQATVTYENEHEELKVAPVTGQINWHNNYTIPTGLTATGTINWKNSGGCFVAGTQIIMADYKMKNIEDIQIGEQVIAYNDNNEQFEIRTVTKSYQHNDTPRVLEITLSNGIILGITPGHPILTTTGWKSRDIANSRWEHNTEADWLNIGDEVIGYFGNAKVITIKELDIPEHYTTYNIEVETCHTFLADGIVVHNMKAASNAAGNVGLAHAKSTLMGELGPEMVVSNGRYFVVGQNGPEFVDLADDAIVFNHLQTQSLLDKGSSSTRGKAITNERNAVAYAHGSMSGGPARATWADWTSQWRYGNTTWRGGSNWINGNGSGNGAGDDTAIEGYLKNLEKWYNLLQEIAKLEEKITYQEQLRAKISSDLTKNGKAYYKSQKQSLEDISKQIQTEQTLVLKQEIERETRMKELSGTLFDDMYDLDADGQLKENESFRAEFDKRFKGNDNGAPPATVQEQYEWLKKRYGEEAVKWDSNGKEIKFTGEAENDQANYKTAVEAAIKRMEDQQSEIQGLTDSINEKSEDILAQEEARNEILAEMRDNQLDVEDMVLDAIVEIRERAIEEMENERDLYQDSTDKLIDGLSQALNNEKEMYEMQSDQEETDKMRRRLAILQSSGGSASEIMNLQDQIQQRDKDMYFEQAQRQIDAIQQASDKEIERLDEQITLEKEVLEYQRAHGLLWNDVYAEMLKSPNEIATFIQQNTEKYWNMSPVRSAKEMDDLLFKTTQWGQYRDDTSATFKQMLESLQLNNGIQQWKEASASLKETFGDYFDKYNKNGELQKIYLEKYEETSDPVAATKAVRDEINRKKAEEEAAAKKAAAAAPAAPDTGGGGGGGSGGHVHNQNGGFKYVGSERHVLCTCGKDMGPAGGTIGSQQTKKTTTKKPQTGGGGGKAVARTKVSGNAFAKGTLLGELGPEAYVSGGKFHVAGLNGAEMINLKKDAIVFNHQQTAQLLNSGYTTSRATPVTNENNAVGNTERQKRIAQLQAQQVQQHEKIRQQQEQRIKQLKESQAKLQQQMQEIKLRHQQAANANTSANSKNTTVTAEQKATIEKTLGITLEKLEAQRAAIQSIPTSLAYSAFDSNGNLVYNNIANDENQRIIIQNASVNMQVEKIANDYDAQRAGQQALEEMLRIARKSGVTSVRR